MTDNDEKLDLTRKQLARVESALESIRREVLPKNAAWYQLMAEGYVEQIRRLRAQIDSYLGIDLLLVSPSNAAACMENVEHATEAVGVIREVDLDERTFSLRERPDGAPPLDCEFDESSESAVKNFLDDRVIITGILRTSRKTKRQTMEVEAIESAVKPEAIRPFDPVV